MEENDLIARLVQGPRRTTKEMQALLTARDLQVHALPLRAIVRTFKTCKTRRFTMTVVPRNDTEVTRSGMTAISVYHHRSGSTCGTSTLLAHIKSFMTLVRRKMGTRSHGMTGVPHLRHS